MKKLHRQFTLLLLCDVALLDVGYLLAFLLKFHERIPAVNLQSYLNVLPYISILAFILLWAYELDLESVSRKTETFASIMLVVLLLNVGAMALAFWSRSFAFPRTVFLLAPLFQIVLLGIWRSTLWMVLRKREAQKNVVVIGQNGDAVSIAEKLSQIAGIEQAAVREISSPEDGTVTSSEEIPWETIEELLLSADIVYVTGSVSRRLREKIVAFCVSQNKEVYLVPRLYDIMLHQAAVIRVGDQPVLKIERLSLTPWQQLVKRIEDLVLAGMVGIFGLVLSPFIAAAIWLTSPGPILYRQLRVGQDGKPFYLYKFRTMVVDAEKMTGPVLATENDPRITPVGRFLRATRLDEIPQLINVLKGEMSFVGPRPERPVFVKRFAEEIPAYAYRFKVKPGITGLAQVKGNYDTEVIDKLRYDLYYIRNYSLWLDLKIILQTMRVVLTPEAARGVRAPKANGVKESEVKMLPEQDTKAVQQ